MDDRREARRDHGNTVAQIRSSDVQAMQHFGSRADVEQIENELRRVNAIFSDIVVAGIGPGMRWRTRLSEAFF